MYTLYGLACRFSDFLDNLIHLVKLNTLCLPYNLIALILSLYNTCLLVTAKIMFTYSRFMYTWSQRISATCLLSSILTSSWNMKLYVYSLCLFFMFILYVALYLNFSKFSKYLTFGQTPHPMYAQCQFMSTNSISF